MLISSYYALRHGIKVNIDESGEEHIIDDNLHVEFDEPYFMF